MKTVSEYLKSNRLKLATISSDMVRKELDVGRSDLAEAVDGLSRQAYKWTTIQATPYSTVCVHYCLLRD